MLRSPWNARCIASLMLAWTLGGCASPPGEPRLAMRLVEDEISLHEPMVVELAIENPTSTTIEVDLGTAGIEALEIEILGRDNRNVERIAPALGPKTWHAGGNLRLQPDEEYRSHLVLGQWFALQEPGDYEVIIEFTGPVVDQRGGEVEVERRFELPLRVLPRDPERLREVAGKLVQKACQSRDLEAAYEGAQVLSTIDDPTVVPYLEDALRCSYTTQGIAIAALGKRATPDSISVLLSAAVAEDPLLADLARHVLESLLRGEPTSITPELRRRMERVLETSEAKPAPDGNEEAR